MHAPKQRKDVVRALHAESHSESWTECRGRIHKELHENQSNSSITVLPRVLEKIPVLLFAGDQDLICNYIGMEAMINALKWNGETGLGVHNLLESRSGSTDVCMGFRLSKRVHGMSMARLLGHGSRRGI